MTEQASAAEEARDLKQEESKVPLVVVELGKRRSPEQIRRLRKGRGKLVHDIDDVVEELVQSGTIKADAQPVVIVVRELATPLVWTLDYDEEDEDENDDEDEDDDEDDEE